MKKLYCQQDLFLFFIILFIERAQQETANMNEKPPEIGIPTPPCDRQALILFILVLTFEEIRNSLRKQTLPAV